MYARTLYFRWDIHFKKPMTYEQKGERFFADFSTTTTTTTESKEGNSCRCNTNDTSNCRRKDVKLGIDHRQITIIPRPTLK